jgi:hypothetical protein
MEGHAATGVSIVKYAFGRRFVCRRAENIDA